MRQLLNVLLLHVLFAASLLVSLSNSTAQGNPPQQYPSQLQAMLAGEVVEPSATPTPTPIAAQDAAAHVLVAGDDNACFEPQYVCTFPDEPAKTHASWLYGWCMWQHDAVEGALKPRECFLRLAGWDYPWRGLLTVDGYEVDYGISLPGRRNSGGGQPAISGVPCTHDVVMEAGKATYYPHNPKRVGGKDTAYSSYPPGCDTTIFPGNRWEGLRTCSVSWHATIETYAEYAARCPGNDAAVATKPAPDYLRED